MRRLYSRVDAVRSYVGRHPTATMLWLFAAGGVVGSAVSGDYRGVIGCARFWGLLEV